MVGDEAQLIGVLISRCRIAREGVSGTKLMARWLTKLEKQLAEFQLKAEQGNAQS